MPEVKRRIIEALKEHGPLTPEEIAEKIGYPKVSVIKGQLTRLKKEGKVVEEAGKYRLVEE
ncbi:MAG: TrmB family transcriptional regulator [Thermoprotei archaeon]|nr:MAG: TrmB family transcriptional regulator [Thermoprotei archaeon]